MTKVQHDHHTSQRRNDDSSIKRSDDIAVRIPLPFTSKHIEIVASGRWIILAAVALGACVGAFWHDIRTQDAHETLTKAIYLNTYVLSLSDEKKQQLDLQEPEEIRRWRRYKAEGGVVPKTPGEK